MENFVFVIGTRPELIKLNPIIELMPADRCYVILTGQHNIVPSDVSNYRKLDIRSCAAILESNLGNNVAAIQTRVSNILQLQTKPDNVVVVVQGDTSSAVAGALAGYYAGMKVAHVEAGLRTHLPNSPFPEEANRKIIAQLAYVHFAPTLTNYRNLIKENMSGSIYITGNTGGDSLRKHTNKGINPSIVQRLYSRSFKHDYHVLVTIHRRESIPHLSKIMDAIVNLVQRTKTKVVWCLHPNPKVSNPVKQYLGQFPEIKLIPPQKYSQFIKYMQGADLIISDSGGVQEEAPSLGKPVIVVREATERVESIALGYSVICPPATITSNSFIDILKQQPWKIPHSNTWKNPYFSASAASTIAQKLVELK